MKIALINPEIETRTPRPATDGSVGFDVYATSKTVVPRTTLENGTHKGGYTAYGTNLAIEIPEGVVAFLLPRSSVRDKSQILSNGIGLPDRDYRGELFFSFKPDGRIGYTTEYEVGECIGQLVFVQAAEVKRLVVVPFENLSQTDRGDQGHGSTEGKADVFTEATQPTEEELVQLPSAEELNQETTAQNEAAQADETDQKPEEPAVLTETPDGPEQPAQYSEDTQQKLDAQQIADHPELDPEVASEDRVDEVGGDAPKTEAKSKKAKKGKTDGQD